MTISNHKARPENLQEGINASFDYLKMHFSDTIRVQQHTPTPMLEWNKISLDQLIKKVQEWLLIDASRGHELRASAEKRFFEINAKSAIGEITNKLIFRSEHCALMILGIRNFENPEVADRHAFGSSHKRQYSLSVLRVSREILIHTLTKLLVERCNIDMPGIRFEDKKYMTGRNLIRLHRLIPQGSKRQAFGFRKPQRHVRTVS